MMQMPNTSAEPQNAMIVSKDGTRIAIITMTTQVAIRMAHFRSPRVYPGRPTKPVEGDTVRALSPHKISRVNTIGRALFL